MKLLRSKSQDQFFKIYQEFPLISLGVVLLFGLHLALLRLIFNVIFGAVVGIVWKLLSDADGLFIYWRDDHLTACSDFLWFICQIITSNHAFVRDLPITIIFCYNM
jgi:hypothetical protein